MTMTGLGTPGIWGKLAGAQRVLVAGAGGGCDVYCGLPIYFALRAMGKEVFLANLSFTNLVRTDAAKLADTLYVVTAETQGMSSYFPELVLAQWLREQGEPSTVYGIERTGVAPVCDAYAALVKYLNVDAVVLVDGGTDSLMRGDEFDLATPEEDVASLMGASACGVENAVLVCTAFGVDAYHGICHAQFLEAVSGLMKAGVCLGVFWLDPKLDEVKKYVEAVEDLLGRPPMEASIVNASMVSAIQGHYGDYHKTRRTGESKLWINPMMALCWAFELAPVVERILYKDAVRETQTYFELQAATARYRSTIVTRGWEDIPV